MVVKMLPKENLEEIKISSLIVLLGLEIQGTENLKNRGKAVGLSWLL